MNNANQPTPRIYKYYFYGIDEPIVIQAQTSPQARDLLRHVFHTLDECYRNSVIIGETVSSMVMGITEKKVDGITYCWVGFAKSPDGWMEKTKMERDMAEFEKKQNVIKI